MIDIYREIDLFEVENGWIIKIVEPIDPHRVDQPSYKSIYCKDMDSVIEKLKLIQKRGK